MFTNAVSFDNEGIDSISGWTLSAVTNNAGALGYMFYGAKNFNRNISNWQRNFGNQYGLQSNFGNANQMNYMFAGINVSNKNTFNNGGDSGISGWVTTKVTDMGHMFYNNNAFNQPIGSWDVISVSASTAFSGMRNMFGNSIFNQNIGSWNMVNVRRIDDMFNGNPVFNNGGSDSISGWSINKVFTISRMFSNATGFNQPLGNWSSTTSAITSAVDVFINATSFNQDLSNWDTSNILDMTGMFYGASAFNNSGSSSISNWVVTAATKMDNMFRSATAFNQDISNWDPINVTSMVNFMTGKTSANYSSTYYDNLLNSWSTKSLESNVNANFGTIKYTVTGQPGRNTLTSAPYNWNIIDGGLGP